MKKFLSFALIGVGSVLLGITNVNALEEISWTNPNALPSTGGEYELNVDVEVSSDSSIGWSIEEDTIINLNGHHITINNPNFTESSEPVDGDSAIKVLPTKSLTITGSGNANEYIASNYVAVFDVGGGSEEYKSTLVLDGITVNAEYNAIVVRSDDTVNVGNIVVNQKEKTNPHIIIKSSNANVTSTSATKGYIVLFDEISSEQGTLNNQFDKNKLYYAGIEGQKVNIEPKVIFNTNRDIDTISIKTTDGNNVAYTESNGIYSFEMPNSPIRVEVKFKDANDTNSDNLQNNTNNDNNNSQSTMNNTTEKNETSNPKTADVITQTLIVTALSLLGLNLLLLIKKRFN